MSSCLELAQEPGCSQCSSSSWYLSQELWARLQVEPSWQIQRLGPAPVLQLTHTPQGGSLGLLGCQGKQSRALSEMQIRWDRGGGDFLLESSFCAG